MMGNFDETDDIIAEKAHLLPAWFCPHMLAKNGHYAMLLQGGATVAVRRILQIHQDDSSRIWLDVEMMSMADAEVYLGDGGAQSRPIIAAVGDQHKASINANMVMIAYELGDRLTYNMS